MALRDASQNPCRNGIISTSSSDFLVSRLRSKFNYYNASRKPFPSYIEHFRNETSTECSVKNHKLFEGLRPEFL
jgi:hypothetical protein